MAIGRVMMVWVGVLIVHNLDHLVMTVVMVGVMKKLVEGIETEEERLYNLKRQDGKNNVTFYPSHNEDKLKLLCITKNFISLD